MEDYSTLLYLHDILKGYDNFVLTVKFIRLKKWV